MSELLEIDGSQGEGGGQIVRSSLALAAITGRGFRISNVRAGRAKPGLKRQHLTALRAAAEICAAELAGDAVGSGELTFRPGPVKAGEYRASVGTAGSATLVLQTVLPALLCADGPSTLRLEGGTHNPGAPPFDFLAHSYLPLIARMGPRISASLERHGFFPAGGGAFTVTVQPSPLLRGFELVERGELLSKSARALVSNLPTHIAERELQTIASKTGWKSDCLHVEEIRGHGPGNVVLIELRFRHVTEVFTAFGRQGVPAERVAKEAVKEYQEYVASDAPVGPHLADQLLLPLGISAWQGGRSESGTKTGGSFRTLPLTRHSKTHIDILKLFLEIDVNVEDDPRGGQLVTVRC